MSAAAAYCCGSFARTQALTEPKPGVMSVEALMYASHIAARFAASLGMNLPAFSAQ